MRIVIDRKEWKRGDGGDTSSLNDGSKMCVLGHLGKACGIDPAHMLNFGEPGDLEREDLYKWPDWVLTYESPDDCTFDGHWDSNGRCCRPDLHPAWTSDYARKVIETNDDDLLPNYRELKLRELFDSKGIQLEFVG